MISPVTVTTGRPKHPREVRERLEVETVILITGPQALRRLTDDCRFPEDRARRVLNIAWEFGQKAEPCPGGYVHIWYHGKDDKDEHIFSVVEHLGKEQKKRVASGKGPRYTQGRKRTASPDSGTASPVRKEGNKMPPRKTRKADPEPETTAPANGEVDYQKYIGKDLSATMEDYVTWFEDNVSSLDDLELDKILTLGVSLYGHFQKSDFNIERREARKAEREATRAADEPEDEPEPAPRTRTRKNAAKPAPARSGRSGAAPAAKPGPRRSRAKAAAAAGGGDAPF